MILFFLLIDYTIKVLVLGSTLFGKVKIPSCIACDRPLLEKVLIAKQVFFVFSSIQTSDSNLIEAF